MKIAMITSVSDGTPWASLTTPNHAEYCRRRGYTFIARHLPYSEAVVDFNFLLDIFEHFDAVWCLDSDAVITNMNYTVEGIVAYSGLSMHVCRENIHEAVRINCGSVIWARGCGPLVQAIVDHEGEWRPLTWIWQQWVEQLFYGEREAFGIDASKFVAVHPPREFNSCDHGDVRNWQPGDFVFHPCGMPVDQRLGRIRTILTGGVTR